ncbi:MAG: hypothetical protein J5747_10945 [Spirochaetaceae bacterium]|nr:hypothetical protein [Spirochaetaceae bacterium]
MEADKNGISDAVRKLTEKLRRFKNAEPESVRVEPVRKDSFLQQRINENEAAARKKTVETYHGYMAPMDVFGADSYRAAAAAKDTDLIFKAYTLYKSVMEASKSNTDDSTRLSHIEIETPLTKNESYTIGGMFIYLQLWLMFEQCIEDYIPIIVPEKGSKYHLAFESLQSHYFTADEKEIMAAVKNAYYS